MSDGYDSELAMLFADYNPLVDVASSTPSACHEMFWVNVQEPAAYEDTDAAHEQREDWRSPLDETETKRARTAE